MQRWCTFPFSSPFPPRGCIFRSIGALVSPDACPADTPTGIPWFVARKKKRKKEKEGETFYVERKGSFFFLFFSLPVGRWSGDNEAYQICEINRCRTRRENETIAWGRKVFFGIRSILFRAKLRKKKLKFRSRDAALSIFLVSGKRNLFLRGVDRELFQMAFIDPIDLIVHLLLQRWR